MEEGLRMARLAGWGAGPVDYRERMEAFASKPNIEGFIVRVLA